MGDVRLVDLEIIKRYSLAVRQEAASPEELLAVLDASRERVLAAIEADSKPAAASKARRPRQKASAE